MWALGSSWDEFRTELFEKSNGDELQFSLQSELMTIKHTHKQLTNTLNKYQISRWLALDLLEELMVMTVIGLMRDELRI